MPSHADKDETKKAKLPDWCTRFHIYGNKQADRLAEQAARYGQVPQHIAKTIIGRIVNARKKQFRVAQPAQIATA